MEEINIQRKIMKTNEEMGKTAAKELAEVLREWTAKKKKRIVVAFAAAPSQDTFLASLCKEKGIDWKKVTAVHLDEYVDLKRGHPNTFESYLREHIFSKVPIPEKNIYFIKSLKGTGEEIAQKYEEIIRKLIKEVRKEDGIYIVILGIGINGHIAFIEPHVDKRTSKLIIPVEIDKVSVRQQYDDYKNHPDPQARYKTLKDVPRKAISMTCAGILEADKIFCIVPGKHKARAVKLMWDGPVSDSLPASFLRMHHCVNIYLDENSASELNTKPKVSGKMNPYPLTLQQVGRDEGRERRL